jgi:site-specific DNA-methyltransferase (adenine-specific)
MKINIFNNILEVKQNGIIPPNSVICGECLKVMRYIPDKSIDMILCDLPYGTTACKWDIVIPFVPLWEQYNRIIKDNGAIVLTGNQPFTSLLISSNLTFFKYEWIFEKSQIVGHGYAKFRPMSNHENICIFGNGKIKYNPQMTPRKEAFVYTRSCRSTSGSSSMSSHDGKTRVLYDKYPTTIQRFNNSDQAKKIHPTQKPVSLFQYLIRTYTDKGNLVLDNCSGSGTTGIACQNTGRDFILIDNNEKFFAEQIKRLSFNLKSFFIEEK